MKSKAKTHNRIEDINQSIEKLLQERNQLTEDLTKDLVTWLMKKNALAHDYDTLIGGIISVLTVIETNDGASIAQKEIWKKEGSKIAKEKKSPQKSA
jgi:hypothetical protein